MIYRPTFMPIDPGDKSRTVVDSSGVTHQPIIGGVVTEAQARSFANDGSNNSTVAHAAITNTVQPSTAQLAGLVAYLAAIQAGTNTGAVETAIAGL